MIAGLATGIAPAAARNALVAHQFSLVSSHGGLNFYIGNNPDYEKTIRLRPGGEFERLAQEPENVGIVSARSRSRYFTGRALEFLRENPGQALRLYARKTRDLVAGREIPRNQDQYGYRNVSTLLALLLWRFGVSFPFGVVAPFALAGAFVRPRGSETAPAPDRERGGSALLLIYAARDYRELAAKNELRPQDVMRMLVHYHAYGDPAKVPQLVEFHRARIRRNCPQQPRSRPSARSFPRAECPQCRQRVYERR